MVGLMLDQLLGAAMEQADMRIDALDETSPSSSSTQAQHAVRRRMLRAEIDRELAVVGRRGVHGFTAFSSPGSNPSPPSHGG